MSRLGGSAKLRACSYRKQPSASFFVFSALLAYCSFSVPASRSWKVSPDCRVYTFVLRRDLTFSDGARFDAEAVRVNFKRIKKLGTQNGAWLDQ
ncbi:ABC transporter substrate-binding protein [Duganella sp. PWIR1]